MKKVMAVNPKYVPAERVPSQLRYVVLSSDRYCPGPSIGAALNKLWPIHTKAISDVPPLVSPECSQLQLLTHLSSV